MNMVSLPATARLIASLFSASRARRRLMADSERDGIIVIEPGRGAAAAPPPATPTGVAPAAPAALWGLAAAACVSTLPLATIAPLGPFTALSAAFAEELDGVGAHFPGAAFLALLVGVGAALEAALHVDRPTLGEVLLAVLGLATPDHHRVPLGAFLLLAVLAGPPFGGGHPQVAHGTVLGLPGLGIGPEVPDEDHLVDSSHYLTPCSFALIAAIRWAIGPFHT